jgi:hypothetical protein
MSQWYKRRKYYKSQNYKILVCDNAEYEEQNYNKDTTKWKVSWEPKRSVSKMIQPGATSTTQTQTQTQTMGKKSIAEQLNITLSIPKNHDNAGAYVGAGADAGAIFDEFEKEESEHENKRNKSKGKSGLMGKGCLLDVSALFGE